MKIDELVARNIKWIQQKARRYYSDPADADDLASETICKCLSHSDHFNDSRSFKPWLVAIMENTFKTQYARRKRVMFTPIEDTIPYPSLDRADQRARLNSILRIIRECRHKSCCIESVLLYAKGYCYDEIAELTKIPVGTVRSRIAAGRRMLRAALGD